MLQTVGTKLTALGGQLVLAWLLAPKDFGLIGLAYTVTAFAGLIQGAGLQEILVQRQRRFERWSTAAFWMSIILGVATAVVMLLLAPLAEWLYKAPSLAGLIAVVALSVPINSLAAVPTARLQSDLRFKTLARVNLLTAVATVALTIMLAWLGLGAYSFVMPRPIVGAAHAFLLWRLARPRVRARLQLRRWRYLLGDSSYMIFASLCYTLVAQGDYIILGRLHPAHVVGIYYFAFNLSIQIIVVFTINLLGVLLPALSKLREEPSRQLTGYLRATRLVAIASVPVSLLQVTLAEPVLRLFFEPEWYPAVPVLHVLSVGTMLSAIGASGGSLIQASGRFRTLAGLSALSAVAFLSLAAVGATVGARVVSAATAMACAVAVYHAMYGPVHMYAAISPIGGTWRDVGSVYFKSVVPGVVAFGAAYSLSRFLFVGDGPRITLVVLGGVGLYLLLVRLFAPEVRQEVELRLAELLRRPDGAVTVKEEVPV
jgi:lipopolysaccharide exporter